MRDDCMYSFCFFFFFYFLPLWCVLFLVLRFAPLNAFYIHQHNMFANNVQGMWENKRYESFELRIDKLHYIGPDLPLHSLYTISFTPLHWTTLCLQCFFRAVRSPQLYNIIQGYSKWFVRFQIFFWFFPPEINV